MWGGAEARCMFAVFCNSRMQQRTARKDRLEIPACVCKSKGVWLRGGIGTESCLLSLHSHRGGHNAAKSKRQANVAGHCCAQFYDDVCGSEYLQRCTDLSTICGSYLREQRTRA